VGTLQTQQYIVKTLGCKANLYDSQLIEAELRRRGWSPASTDSEADLCIINSCTVTDEADRQSRRAAARLSRTNPRAQVVITGCAAEIDPERLARSKGISYVIGNRDKHLLVDLVLKSAQNGYSAMSFDQGRVLGQAEGYEEMISRHPMDLEWPTPKPNLNRGSERTRAFLKVQDGCNSFCTYCIIPYGRGPSRSLKISEVIEQIRQLVIQGVREVVITGINIGDYGADWGDIPGIEVLLEAILAETKLERLRVSSLDPTEITPRLIKLTNQEPRLCPHFHVSLQSPHSRILRLMKRKYSFNQVKECLQCIAEIPAPVGGVFVGMDVITGFPGETEEEFHWSLETLRDLSWSRLHVFPYSERNGTPATRLKGQVLPKERARRAQALRELSLQRLSTVYQGVLKRCNDSGLGLERVLVEGITRGPDGSSEWVSGYTPNYLRVLIPLRGAPADTFNNQIIRVSPKQLMVDRPSGDVAFIAESLG
jgi:threonylcarbamoyladenosine tRNA methylthiotransferase MtaB